MGYGCLCGNVPGRYVDGVPHPDYRFQAHVCVAVPGPGEAAASGEGPRGKFHSKSQTTLRYAIEDVKAWAANFRTAEYDGQDAVDCHLLLTQATASQLEDAIAHAVERLDFHFEESSGGSLNLVFSGHGSPQGDLVLADRLVSPDELMEWCAVGRAGDDEKTRHLRIVVDSCYSGRTLCRLLLHQDHWKRVVVRDGFAACLPSEEAFELRSLGLSVLTYSMLRPGRRLSLNVSELTESDIRELKRSLRETTQWLTNGEQHAFEVINGHAISLPGGRASVEVLGMTSLEQLIEAVESLSPRRRAQK